MKKRLYEVELKSAALLREGKKSLITYFEGGHKKTVASNVRYLYPQYTKAEDKPMVEITPISREEYQARVDGGYIKHKRHLIKGSGFVMKEEDYETVGN